MEQKIIFREMLSEILALADSKQNRLTVEEIDQFFSNTHLTKEQLELVYEYLVSQKVQVEGYTKEGPNRFADTQEPGAAGIGSQRERKGAGASASGGEEAETDAGNRAEEEEAPCSMELYLEEIKQIQAVEPAVELELFTGAAGKDGEAKKRLVELYLPLVCRMAGDYEGDDCPVEDLIQEGNMGLLLAVDHLEKQESLAAYQARLMNEVNQYMQDALQEQRDLREMGNGIAKKVNHLSEAIHNLEEDLEHKVSLEELSAYLEMPVEEIKDILKMAGDEIEVEGYENK